MEPIKYSYIILMHILKSTQLTIYDEAKHVLHHNYLVH